MKPASDTRGTWLANARGGYVRSLVSAILPPMAVAVGAVSLAARFGLASAIVFAFVGLLAIEAWRRRRAPEQTIPTPPSEFPADSQHELLERFNLATESAGIGVWDWNLETGSLATDANMQRLFDGVSFTGLTGRQFIERLVHSDDREAFMAGMLQSIKNPATDRMAARFRYSRPDGSLQHVQLHGRIIRGADGRARRFLGVSWNITSQVESALRLEEQARHMQQLVDRYNLATEVAGIAVWDWDVKSQEVHASSAHAQAVVTQGVADGSIEGTTTSFTTDTFLNHILHPEDRPAFVAAITRGLETGEPISLRYRTLRGEHIEHLQFHGRVLRDSQGAPQRLLGINWSVSDEVRAAEMIREQNEAQRALLFRLDLATKVAGIGVWDWDLVHDRLAMDESVGRAYGRGEMTCEANVLEFVLNTVVPEDRAEFESALRAAFAAGETFSYRYRALLPSDRTIHVQVSAHILRDNDGRALRMLGVSQDITSEIRSAESLQQRAEHERALMTRLSVATRAANISCWEYDPAIREFVWEENRLRAYGLDNLTLPEFSRAFRTIVHPDDLQTMDCEVAEALAEKREIRSYRFRVLRADGTQRYMQLHAKVVRDTPDGQVKLAGVTWDVTNEVQTTEMLQRQAEQERGLLTRLSIASEAAGIGSWEIDLQEKRYLWVENPIRELEDIFREMPTLAEFEARIHPDDRQELPQALLAAATSKVDRISCRYRARSLSGEWIHVQAHARLVADEHGQLVRLLGVSWNNTHEVVAAARLEQQAEDQRVLKERVTVATQAASVSTWEIDVVAGKFLWMENPIVTIGAEERDDFTAFQQRVVPDDRNIFADNVRQAKRAGRDSMSYVFRARGANDSIRYIQSHAKLYFDDNHRPIRALGASWDITKEVEANDRLMAQAHQLSDIERRLERASLSSSEGHWEWDLLTGSAWSSSSFHALLGYADRSLPNDLEAVLATTQLPDDVKWQQVRFDSHLATGVPYEFETRLRTAAGEIRWFKVRGMAERDAAGKPIRMAGSIQDIHQQKLAEGALQRAQQRFERAITGTQDGLWELEANGIAWCSPRVGELLGYAPGELPSETNFLRECLHPDDRESVAVATQAHFQDAALYDVEIRLQTKSGTYRWYRARASAERDAEGRPLRLSGSLQDVTDARAAREALVQATEAAQAASRAKSDFLANVSHEIRTPMNGIIGMTGLILDTPLDRTQREYAETIRSSADSLLTVINDILDFSKIEAGKLDIEHLEMDLRVQVEEVGAMMALQAAAKHLELIVHVHPQVPERVIGDPQRLRQCLINLVGNAIKFTRQGEIVIEVCTVGHQDGKVLTHFEVKDTGIGIGADTLKTLFQPFVQADSSTTRHFGGTGLGLSIVRRLAEMMGGQVGVESQVGTGSTFWFTLPLESLAAAPNEQPMELARLGRRVLVVDDNDTNRRVVANQLQHAGYDVSLAASADSALTLLHEAVNQEHPFEVVLADYQMPETDGAMLGERINADPNISQARLVLLTSLDRQGDVKRFASLGFAGYLTKPIRAKELFDCLDRVLANESKEWHMQSQPLITRSRLVANTPQVRFHGKVLLTEDNLVNQKVALRYLERLGLTVTIANNGEEALEAMQSQRFDLILMDLQMPVMDGLTATRTIREREQPSERSTPIVALTANAMVGQLETCLAAGMNGFLTKPLDVNRLKETLERFGLGFNEAKSEGTVDERISTTLSTSPPIDLGRLNELTEGDTQFAIELAEVFIASGADVLAEMNAALAEHNRLALAKAAHKLKGASANIHALSLRDLSMSIESQAPTAGIDALTDLAARSQQEYERAAAFFREHVLVEKAKQAG